MFSLKKTMYVAIMSFSIFSTFIFMIFSRVDDAYINLVSTIASILFFLLSCIVLAFIIFGDDDEKKR